MPIPPSVSSFYLLNGFDLLLCVDALHRRSLQRLREDVSRSRDDSAKDNTKIRRRFRVTPVSSAQRSVW